MYPGHWAKVSPEKPALINAATGAAVTFGELNDRSNRLAQLMWDRGLRRGDHIAVLMENHARYFDVIWAAMRSGLYLTTINRYLTTDEAAYILDNCEAKVLVASHHLADIAGGLPATSTRCKTWLMVDGTAPGYHDYEQATGAYPARPLADEPAGAFMLYSSGTTGRPKGILRALPPGKISDDAGPIGGLQKQLWNFGSDTVYLSPAPMYHSAPLGFSTGTQALGGTVVMMPKFDPLLALQAIEDYRVTASQWVPTMFSRMLKVPEAERSGYDLSSHKVAIHAAAPCPKQVKQQMFDWWGPILYEYYGGTEFNGLTHVTPQDWLKHPGTVGRSVFGTLHVCDERGEIVPNGESGLVYFEQPQMPFEYFHDKDKTKGAQHPQHPNWSALGDVGYIDDEGYLFLTDRATFMIISGGVNIYPQEIEDAMVMHPKVADVAVVGVPNEEMGEEVKAVVQLALGIAPSPEVRAELMAYAREHIAHYKCPRSIDFEAELPRLPTGKLYKRILKDRYWGKHDSRIV
jgi:fatty-acyl-CoA synthase